jgi:D-3-phosphoglycerate dehydrogenase
MSRTVLIATKSPFAEDARNQAVELIQQAGYTASVLERYQNRDELIAAAAKADALIVRSDNVDAGLLDAAPGLTLVIRGGAGYNNIDVEACTARNVIVMNTPGQNSNAVSELAVGLMLGLYRSLTPADSSTKAGEFRKSELTGRELRGKKLGIHGFGYIGQLLAQKARGFGMSCFAFDPWVSPETAATYDVELVHTAQDLYRDADIVSVHLPKTATTVGSVNYDLLCLMRPNGTLINTARAEVVDHDALVRVLEERPAFRYGADVHPEGDVAGEKRLSRFSDRVVLTPHIGASTVESNVNTVTAAARQAVGFFQEGRMTAAINKSVVPYWLQDYAELAQVIGLLCSKISTGQPREVNVICYGDLESYAESFAQNVAKGVYRDFDPELTPQAAANVAAENGVQVRSNTKPDNSRGHGNAITVDYVVSDAGTLHMVTVRGTVADGMLKISRIGEFVNVDFQATGLVTIFQYAEKEGMVDVIGRYYTDVGFNKKQGRFIQSPGGNRQICLFQLERIGKRAAHRSDDESEIHRIVQRVVAEIPEVDSGYVVNFGG